MTHSEDDDQDLADHGTVIMDRKAASGIPRPAANSKSRSRPSPPPIVPAAGALPTTPATPPASTGLPVLSPSISGVTPSQPAPAASSSANKRLAALVAFGSFTVVFVIGALIMILIRLARDSADEPRPNGAVQTKPVNSPRTTSK